MSEQAVSIFPDSIQLTRIHTAFPGRQFRYLPGDMDKMTGTADDYYGIIEGDPDDPEDRLTLQRLKNEIGPTYVILVLGRSDWAPPK